MVVLTVIQFKIVWREDPVKVPLFRSMHM